MKQYGIRDREAGNVIDLFDTYQEAKDTLVEYEEQDKEDGNYTENFYEIFEIGEQPQYDIEDIREYINKLVNKKRDEYSQEIKKNVVELEKVLRLDDQVRLLSDIENHLTNVIFGKEEL